MEIFKVWWFRGPHLIDTDLQGFVHSRRVRSLPKDQLLAFEAFRAVNCPARHQHFRIAGSHHGCFSIDCNFEPTLENAKILLVILREFIHIQHNRHICLSRSDLHSPCANVAGYWRPLHQYRLCSLRIGWPNLLVQIRQWWFPFSGPMNVICPISHMFYRSLQMKRLDEAVWYILPFLR